MSNQISAKELEQYFRNSKFYNYKEILHSCRPDIRDYYLDSLTDPKYTKRNLIIDNFQSSFSNIDNQAIVVVEVGGTNFRLSLVNFNSEQTILEIQSKPAFTNTTFSIKTIVEMVISQLEVILQKRDYIDFLGVVSVDEIKLIAFVLAFPLHHEYTQNNELNTFMISAAKEIDVSSVINIELNSAFISEWKTQIGVGINTIVINDSIASTLSLEYLNREVKAQIDIPVNLIIGTGLNLAAAVNFDKKLHIVNTESGFIPIDKFKGLTTFDKKLNDLSTIKNNFVEQMISGKYLPLLIQIVTNDLAMQVENLDSIEEYLEFASTSINDNKDHRPKIVHQIIEILIVRGTDFVSEMILGLIRAISKLKEIDQPTVGILFEGSLLNKTDFKDILMKNISSGLLSSYHTKVYDRLALPNNKFTIRYSAIGAAYLISKMYKNSN